MPIGDAPVTNQNLRRWQALSAALRCNKVQLLLKRDAGELAPFINDEMTMGDECHHRHFAILGSRR
jgi:hypothetical protein